MPLRGDAKQRNTLAFILSVCSCQCVRYSSRVIGSCFVRSPGWAHRAPFLCKGSATVHVFLPWAPSTQSSTCSWHCSCTLSYLHQMYFSTKRIFQGCVKPKQLFWFLMRHLPQVPQPWPHFFVSCTTLFLVRALTRELYPSFFFLTSSWVRQVYREEQCKNNGKNGPSIDSKEKIRRTVVYCLFSLQEKEAFLKWMWLFYFLLYRNRRNREGCC